MQARAAARWAGAGLALVLIASASSAALWALSGWNLTSEPEEARILQHSSASTPAAPVVATQSNVDTKGQTPADCQILEDELEAVRAELAIAQGQIEVLVGVPRGWTDDVPSELRPERVDARLEAFLADQEHLELVELDCSEYPCVAVLEGMSLEFDQRDIIEEEFGIMKLATVEIGGVRPPRYILAVGDKADLQGDSEHRPRIDYRVLALADVSQAEMFEDAVADKMNGK